jgi:hypothetical protein
MSDQAEKLQELQHMLREKEEQLRENEEQLREKEELLQEKEELLRENEEQLRKKEEQLSFNNRRSRTVSQLYSQINRIYGDFDGWVLAISAKLEVFGYLITIP